MPRGNRTKAYYDKHATRWTDAKTNSFHHEKQFTEFVSLLPERGSVIDIGCAGGVHVPMFLGIGRKLRYTGVDISPSFLTISRRRYPQLTFLLGNVADAATLPKKKYDGFFAGAVLMHTPHEEWPAMLANIESLMKPRGIGYLTLPTEHPSGDTADADPRHFTLLTAAEQQKEFKSRGWKILKKGTLNGFTKKGIWKWYLVELP